MTEKWTPQDLGDAAVHRNLKQAARAAKGTRGGAGAFKSGQRSATTGAFRGHKTTVKTRVAPVIGATRDHASVTVNAGGGVVIKVEGSQDALPGILQRALDTVLGSIPAAGSGDSPLRDSARDSLLASEDRYTPPQLVDLISIGRRTVDRKRRNRQLVAVQVANRFEYPAFQVDKSHGRIYPIVEELNPLLPSGDEWDVLSWWIQPNASLPPGTRPADLVPGGKDDHESLRRLVLSAGADD